MPERMCVGCRGRAPQGDLVRLVASADGVVVDRSRTAPGRGAYLHPVPACLDRALRTRALGRALRTTGGAGALPPEFLEAIGGGPA